MKEFMTKVSDYLNERRNNPEKQEDRIAAVIIGAVAVVVIILLLLVLWGYIAKERSKEEDALVSATYEEHAPEYMSQGDGEGALTQEYLDNIAYLNDMIEKLLASLTQMEQNLSETVEQYQEGDASLREEITSLRTDVSAILRSLKATQTKLQDLIDIVMVMNDETIPIIQAQIAELYENMNQIYTDIANMYAKYDETIPVIQAQIAELYENINQMYAKFASKVLQYRYDENENILYLEPYQEDSAAASTSGNAPSGSLSAYGNRVVFSSKDAAYLDNELDLLLNEIDESILGSISADEVFDSAGQRRNLLTSHGIINYSGGKVVANAASLVTLADKTDTLANAYAAVACRSLNYIGTYFNADEGTNHTSQAAGTIALDCTRIAAGVLQSQSVEHLEAAPIIEDNLTAGTAAWVNGKCIIGNGADNERAYQRGIDDGRAKNIENVDIEYTYHKHTGNSGKNPIPDGDVYYSLTNPRGCYVAAGHNHDYGGCVICTGTAELDFPSISTREDGLTYGAYYCITCGSPQYAHTGPDDSLPRYIPCATCISTTTNTWKVDCGKKAGQIETAKVSIRTYQETHE